MSVAHLPVLGRCRPAEKPAFAAEAIANASARVREAAHVVLHPDGHVGVAFGGDVAPGAARPGEYGWIGSLPPLFPEWLGDRGFGEAHGTRFPYIAGAMANGIGSTAIVVSMARAGMIGFFGAAGLSLGRVEKAVDEIQAAVEGLPYGCNLIHSPAEPLLEAGVVELYLKKGVRRVSAAAYMGLTPHVVRFACTGLRQLPDGRIARRNHVFAKISRPEVAARFMRPAPKELLDQLVAKGQLTAEEARLAAHVPLAGDVTVESDSGGHTDNRPLGSLFPVIVAQRDQIAREHGYAVRVGAAGGLGTPRSVASAFSLGAAYVLTGSVNQGSVEAGISPRAKQMLTLADVADVTMAPAADMFELGVEVQVLKRGTMFAARGHKLKDLYDRHASWDEIPAGDRAAVEKDILRAPFAQVWEDTKAFWNGRDARQVEKADKDARHKMALVFRWYLGKSSRWAIEGDESRVADYQIWCGPAQGAFNAWVKGSFLEPAGERTVVQIARNLLEGAAVCTRAQQLRTYGVPVPEAAFAFSPRPLA
ncbi:MAG: PfaD family polyunsaturated fatty acid/polyketide biosynthesis protein [Myxococcota bacterium]